MNQLNHFSVPVSRFALVCACLILLTSSFDIFLVVEAGGNYRFCQLLIPPLIVLALVKTGNRHRVPTLGLVPLFIWFAVQLCLVPATEFWVKSLGYCLWLLLNLGMYFSFVQLFSGNASALATLLRWYLRSFGIISVFGIVQFTFPILGLGAPLVKQWWIPGFLPRVNGFSYEPSYFATYLLTGFVFAGSLQRGRSTLLSSRSLMLIRTLTAIGIILSSSRIGIAFLLIELFLPSVKLWRSVVTDLTRFRISKRKAYQLVPYLLAVVVSFSVAAVSLMAVEQTPGILLVVLNGTGLSDTAAHSVVERATAFDDTLTTFYQHPLIGSSLGGVSSRIAGLHSEQVTSFEASNRFYPISVFAEVLAASGIVGVIPFAWFLVESIRRPLQLAKRAQPGFAIILRGLVRSVIHLWAILQFNQNVLRGYLWVHLAIIATLYAASYKPPAGAEQRPSAPEPRSVNDTAVSGMTAD